MTQDTFNKLITLVLNASDLGRGRLDSRDWQVDDDAELLEELAIIYLADGLPDGL